MAGGGLRARLLSALLLSTLIHLLAGGGIPWPTGQPVELPGPPIAARLEALPKPPLAQQQTDARRPRPAAAQPTPLATPRAETDVQPLAEAALPPAAQRERASVPEPPPSEPSTAQPEGPASPPPLHPQLPSGFTVRYVVQGSEGGLTLGHIEHIWQRDEARYSLYALARATGLVRLIYSGLLSQTSFGQITPEGLRPEHYWMQRGSRRLRIHFDWAAMQADLGERYPPLALRPGSQDLLSVVYQLALFPHAEGELWVLDGKTAKAYRLEPMGSERVALPLGSVQTRHLRIQASEGPERIDVWLKDDPPHLPLKLHMQGSRSGSAVLMAESIRGLPLIVEEAVQRPTESD